MRWIYLILCGGVLALPGCGEETFPSPPPPVMSAETESEVEEPSEGAKTSSLTGEKRSFAGLKFAVPANWVEKPLSDMQRGILAAKFSMPDAGSGITLSLSRSGGGVDANLDRWRGQVSSTRPEITDSISVAGVDSTLIDLEGEFAGGFGKPAQSNWRMLGIVVPLPDQGYFLKLTGPVAEVSAVEEEFLAFARSASKG